MSQELSTLKMQIGSVFKDLRTDFQCVVLENPEYTAIGSTKDLQKNSWLDEDGDDVYIPSAMKISAGTLKVSIGYQGKRGTGKPILQSFVKWLMGRGGVSLDADGILLYMPFIDEGYSKVTFKSVGDIEYSYLGTDELLSFSVTFNVPDPFANVSYNEKLKKLTKI